MSGLASGGAALGHNRLWRASGFSPARTVILVYMASGFLAALAAWMLLGKLEASVPTLGVGLTLNVVAAAVIGGVSLKGGEGSIIGAFAGVLFLAMVNNALILMNVDPLWVNAVCGLIFLVALIIDAQKTRYRGRGASGRETAAPVDSNRNSVMLQTTSENRYDCNESSSGRMWIMIPWRFV